MDPLSFFDVKASVQARTRLVLCRLAERVAYLLETARLWGDRRALAQGGGARLRGCYFNPASCFGAFVELPIADAEAYDSRQWRAATSTPLGNGDGDGAQCAARSMDVCAGIRYSSPAFSAGVMGSPLDGSVNALWMVRFVVQPSSGEAVLRHPWSRA